MNKAELDALRNKSRTGLTAAAMAEAVIPLLDYCDKLEAQLDDLGTPASTHDHCCHPIYIKRDANGARLTTTISLSEYHRANLLWLLCDVAGYNRKEAAVLGLNTGDWNGEIPMALCCTENNGPYEEPSREPNIDYTTHLRIPDQEAANKELQKEMASHVSTFLANTLHLELLQRKLQAAYDEIREAYKDEPQYVAGALARVEQVK